MDGREVSPDFDQILGYPHLLFGLPQGGVNRVTVIWMSAATGKGNMPGMGWHGVGSFDQYHPQVAFAIFEDGDQDRGRWLSVVRRYLSEETKTIRHQATL